MAPLDFAAIIPKFDAILARGLSLGLGDRDGQMCIEAAVCAALDLPHGDQPTCVAPSVRRFKIALNDKNWSSPEARSAGLRDLGIAQIGSAGVVNDIAFVRLLAERTIRVLVPDLFRRVFTTNDILLAAALRCEQEGTAESARAASAAANAASAAYAAAASAAASAAAYAADAAAYAAYDAAADAAADAADAASAAASAAYDAAAAAAAYAATANPDYYLRMIAGLALDVLIELKSPGAAFIGARS